MDISNVAYSSPIKVKGVTELVDPYDLPVRMEKAVFRPENYISLKRLRI